MKTIEAIFVCCFVVLPAFVQAQQPATPIALIKKLEDEHRTAVMAGDTATLFRLWSGDYVVNNANNMILTAEQLKAFIRKGGIDHPSFTGNTEKITFFGNTAVVMGSEMMTQNGGKPIYRRYTNVWIKASQSWLLCARQVTSTLVQ